MKEVAGRVAAITGAGSGFGREFARIAARERMKLVLADVQQETLDVSVAEALESGVEALGIQTDVSKPDDVQRFADRAIAKFGAVHLLFNKPIIDADVDGPASLPRALDDEVRNLGRYLAARRVARTVFLGSAPLAGSPNQGLDAPHVRLQRQQARRRDRERDAVPRLAPGEREGRRIGSMPCLRSHQHQQLGAESSSGAHAQGGADEVANRGPGAIGKSGQLRPPHCRRRGADDLRCGARERTRTRRSLVPGLAALGNARCLTS